MNTPVFNRIIAVMSIAAFSAYWGATFFFTMPDNYLKIKALAYDKVFQSIFYQQWSFFAPPPTYNDFLYFEFADTLSGEVQTFEVLSELHKTRRAKFIFNDKESVLENILSNSINGLEDQIRETFQLYKRKECKEIDEELCFENFRIYADQEINDSNSFQTLANYGRRLAAGKGLSNTHVFRFTITNKDIPRFAERNNEDVKIEEKIVFKSEFIPK